MVVADRSARREGVAEPEVVVGGDGVGLSENEAVPCRRRRRVGSSPSRWTTRPSDDRTGGRVDVVGDVEQSGDELPVTPDDGLPATVRWRPSRRNRPSHRAARSRRSDRLRLHQAQNLGAIVPGRSDQRSPPRATRPKRRCTPPPGVSARTPRIAAAAKGEWDLLSGELDRKGPSHARRIVPRHIRIRPQRGMHQTAAPKPPGRRRG